MKEVVFTSSNGSWVRIDPAAVESVRPAAEGIHVRLVNGMSKVVRAPYFEVLEQLAGS